MYTLSYNLKRILKRKWRERINIKNVGKIKTKILRMDVIYGGLGGRGGGGGGGGGGSRVNKQRTFSVTHFEF